MVVALQTLYNPATGAVRAIDISGGTAEVMALYNKGWRPYSATPEQTQAIVKQAQSQQHHLNAAVTAQPQPQMTPLTKYVDNGQVDLVKLWRERDYYAINYAKNIYGDDVVNKAKKIENLTSKEPILMDDYLKLSSDEKGKYRLLAPASLDEYNKMDELEKAEHFIESKGVGSGTYSRLGPGTTKIFHPDLSAWEKVTPWKEEAGQKATTKNILLWEAEIAVPFVYVARNWDKIGNTERAFHLVLDSVFIGALAAKPISKALSAATGAITNKSLGKAGAKVVMTEIKALDRAVVAGNTVDVQRAGARLQALGEAMQKQGVSGAQKLIAQGKKVKAKALQIAAQELKLAPQGHKVTKGLKKLAKSERGSIGTDDIKFPIPDDELVKSGLSKTELAEILDKVGDDATLFRLEIVTRQRVKAGVWQKIKKGKEAADKAIEQKHIKPEDAGLQKAPTKAKPKTVVTTKVIEKEEQKFIEQIEKLLEKAKVKKEAKHPIAYKVAQQQYKQAQIIAKIAAEVAQKKAMRERIRQVVLKILRSATVGGLAAALAGKTQQQIQAAVRAAIRTQTRTLTDAEVKELVSTAAMTKTLTETATATATATKKALAVKPFTVPKAKSEIVVAPEIRPLTDLVPAPIPSPTPTPTPPPAPVPPGTPSPKPPPSGPPTGKPKPDKKPKRRRPGSAPKGYEVKKVVGIPDDAGRVSFNSGIVKVTIVPPYQKDDIEYTILKEPQTGKGSQQDTLRVRGGDAPTKLVLSRGIDLLTISSGKRMSHSVRGPNMLIDKGKRQRQRRGMVI